MESFNRDVLNQGWWCLMSGGAAPTIIMSSITNIMCVQISQIILTFSHKNSSVIPCVLANFLPQVLYNGLFGFHLAIEKEKCIVLSPALLVDCCCDDLSPVPWMSPHQGVCTPTWLTRSFARWWASYSGRSPSLWCSDRSGRTGRRMSATGGWIILCAGWGEATVMLERGRW